MLTISHIWCIYYICADLWGILQVGFERVDMQVEAKQEEKLSNGSSSGLTRLQMQSRQHALDNALLLTAGYSGPTLTGEVEEKEEGKRQRESLRLHTASLVKSGTVSHPYGFLFTNPSWLRFSRWGRREGGFFP